MWLTYQELFKILRSFPCMADEVNIVSQKSDSREKGLISTQYIPDNCDLGQQGNILFLSHAANRTTNR